MDTRRVCGRQCDNIIKPADLSVLLFPLKSNSNDVRMIERKFSIGIIREIRAKFKI